MSSATLVSLGQVVVPVAGMMLLVAAMRATGMTGMRSGALIDALPKAAFAFFAARWLGDWLFTRTAWPNAPGSSDRRAEATVSGADDRADVGAGDRSAWPS